MKKKILSSLCIMSCVLLLMTGCQKTPKEKAVVQKNTSAMLQKEESNKTTIKDFPATYKDSYENGAVKCNYNAEFDTKNVDKVPIYNVSYDSFTQEQATNFLDKTLKGQDLYEIPENWTKTEYEHAIKEMKKTIADLDCGNSFYDETHTYSEKLEEYKEEYKKAPDAKDVKTSLKFMKGEDGGESIRGYAKNEDGSKKIVQISNNDYTNAPMHPTVMGYINMYDEVGSYVDYNGLFAGNSKVKKNNVTLSEEDALKQAEALLKEYGIDDFYWNGATRLVADGNKLGAVFDEENKEDINVTCAYSLAFTRKVNGVPISTPESVTDIIQPFITEVASDDQQAAADSIEDDSVNETLDCECINILVNDKGIVLFSWFAPYKVEKAIVDDAHLLAADELTGSLNTFVGTNYAGDTSSEAKYDINKIELNYQKIEQENSDSSSLLVPVWTVRGDLESSFTYEEDGKTKTDKTTTKNSPFWTINAIDGSQLTTSNMKG